MAKRSKAEAVAAKALTAASLADDGAAIGSIFGPTGAGIGGVIGGLTGLIIGDQTTVFPLDMVAIPAYQAYMIQGNPSMQVYIKEGEVLTQVIQTEAQEAATALSSSPSSTKPKRRKTNPWIKFSKGFDYRKKRKNESAKAYLSARAKAASRAYKKLNKGGTKKGQVRKTARRAYMKKK